MDALDKIFPPRQNMINMLQGLIYMEVERANN